MSHRRRRSSSLGAFDFSKLLSWRPTRTQLLIGGGVAAGALLLFSSGASALPGQPRTTNNQWWQWPVPASSRLTSTFGCRPNIKGISTPASSLCNNDPGLNFHGGIDLANVLRTPLFAAADGKVATSAYSSSNGNYLIITHSSGWDSRYCHLASPAFVKAGQAVRKGQLIGAMGSTGLSTGSHLHFETRYNGDPRDPQSVIEKWAPTSIAELAFLDDFGVEIEPGPPPSGWERW